MHPVRTQARALIVHDGRLALIRIVKNNLERWVLPGGGQDAGESLTETLVRECAEELGIRVRVGPLQLIREFVPGNHPREQSPFRVQCIDFIFRCSVLGSTDLHLGTKVDDEAIEARWIELAQVSELPLYPTVVKTHLAHMLNSATPLYLGDQL